MVGVRIIKPAMSMYQVRIAGVQPRVRLTQETSSRVRWDSLSALPVRPQVYAQFVTRTPALSLPSKGYASQMVSVGQHGLGGVHR